MKKQRKKTVFAQRGSIARVFFYVNAALWLLLSLNTLAEMIVDNNDGVSVALVSFFLLVNVLAMFFGGRLLNQTEKWTYIFAFVVVLLNIALSFTGVPELLYFTALVIDLIILMALISLKENYFK
jgi:purine-cytosine permease-like protein